MHFDALLHLPPSTFRLGPGGKLHDSTFWSIGWILCISYPGHNPDLSMSQRGSIEVRGERTKGKLDRHWEVAMMERKGLFLSAGSSTVILPTALLESILMLTLLYKS